MKSIIHDFYTSFSALEAEKMIVNYHPDITFQDAAFGVLKGERACNMWRMLLSSQKGKDFKVTFSNIVEDENGGTADWEAKYIFSRTGRKVHNKVQKPQNLV